MFCQNQVNVLIQYRMEQILILLFFVKQLDHGIQMRSKYFWGHILRLLHKYTQVPLQQLSTLRSLLHEQQVQNTDQNLLSERCSQFLFLNERNFIETELVVQDHCYQHQHSAWKLQIRKFDVLFQAHFKQSRAIKSVLYQFAELLV